MIFKLQELEYKKHDFFFSCFASNQHWANSIDFKLLDIGVILTLCVLDNCR